MIITFSSGTTSALSSPALGLDTMERPGLLSPPGVRMIALLLVKPPHLGLVCNTSHLCPTEAPSGSIESNTSFGMDKFNQQGVDKE